MERYKFIRHENESLNDWLQRAISFGIFKVRGIEWSEKNYKENISLGTDWGTPSDQLQCHNRINEELTDNEMICYLEWFN